MGSYCGHKICDHSSLMERCSYYIEQIHNNWEYVELESVLHRNRPSTAPATFSSFILETIVHGSVLTRTRLSSKQEGCCSSMMMAPVQLWNPTELVSAAAPAAAAAAARNCTQTPLCLGSKFRDADDMRESGSAFFHKFHGQNFFQSKRESRIFANAASPSSSSAATTNSPNSETYTVPEAFELHLSSQRRSSSWAWSICLCLHLSICLSLVSLFLSVCLSCI